MRLSSLLADRARFSVGELATIGIGLCRLISAYHYQGLAVGPFGMGDIEVLSDGSAVLRKAGGAVAAGAELADDITQLATLLLQLARCGGVVGTPAYPALQAHLVNLTRQPMLAGDFAISLTQFGPVPVRYRDSRTARFGAALRRTGGPEQKEVVARLDNSPLRQSDWRTWLTPSLLGLAALASWGLALGLWLGV